MTKYQAGRMYLPPDTVYYTIEGGNHAQFGDYGHQKVTVSQPLMERIS